MYFTPKMKCNAQQEPTAISFYYPLVQSNKPIICNERKVVVYLEQKKG